MREFNRFTQSSFLFIVLLLTSCIDCDRDAERTCDASDPLTQLPWLKQERLEMESMTADLRPYFYIASGRYKNQRVFVFSDCCPNCGTISEVKDCYGKLMGRLEADIPADEIEGFVLIYGGAECSF